MGDFPDTQVADLKEILKKAICDEMEANELTQGDVARTIGLDRRNVNKILRGTERGVSIDQFIRIANGIGLQVNMVIKRKKG